MKQVTRDWLNALNLRFYESEAAAFNQTRQHGWRGFERVLAQIHASAPRVLDLGCGNGRLIDALQKRWGKGFAYSGVDASPALLRIARARFSDAHVTFVETDFVTEDPERSLPQGEYDLVALLGVLHHVPSFTARKALLEAAARRLSAGGLLAFTLWRFDRDPRFERRRVAFETDSVLAIDPRIVASDLDRGDQLLRWGDSQSATSLRYCHFVDEAELAALLDDLGMVVAERFRADGAADALNDYLLLRVG